MGVRFVKIVSSSLKRALRRIFESAFKITGKEEVRLKKLGRFTSTYTVFLKLRILIVDSASFLFMKDEIFNKEIYKFQTERDDPLIIDCGANIGLSVLYFKRNYPNAEIIAFEPDAKVFEALKFNIEAFGYFDIKLINKALWNSETRLGFVSEGADAGRLSFDEQCNIGDVSTLSLKPFLTKRRVDLLKIDIEGAETTVLLDCKDVLENVDRLFVEYHSFVGREQTLDTLLGILRESGFRCYISHIGVTSRYPFLERNQYMGMDNQLNIFAARN